MELVQQQEVCLGPAIISVSRVSKPNCFSPNKRMLLDPSVSSFPPGFKRIRPGEGKEV